ncbi:hypothetical protein LINPERPRIM_LOCUS21122 [Linum perenne]
MTSIFFSSISFLSIFDFSSVFADHQTDATLTLIDLDLYHSSKMEVPNPKDEESSLVTMADRKLLLPQPTKNHTRDVHILSSTFLLIFLAHGTTHNLKTTANSVGLYVYCC